MKFAALLTILWFATVAEAKPINTGYVSFQISDRWDCQREDQFAFMCIPKGSKPPQEAIIIVSGKEAGPEDNFESFQKFLKVPRAVEVPGSRPVQSQIQYVRMIEIAKQPWADAGHLNSELYGYHTRYLATVKQKLSVLVSLSVSQRQWKLYEKDFAMVANSLALTDNVTVLAQPFNLGQTPAAQNQFPVGAQVAPGSDPGAVPGEKKQDYTLFLIVAAGVALLAIYVLKK